MNATVAPLEALRRHWGFVEFRPLQREAVEAALAGRDSLVVLATGGGKSLCYQIPAACGAGMALVVSPLIALMDDQAAAAREAGLRVGALHSGLEDDERHDTQNALDRGELDLLYVSPERLLMGDLLSRLEGRLVLIAVDEAHCVSHWGHDFRPEYRQLATVMDRFPGAARMALTATATPAVQRDICEQLGLRSPARFIGHPDRANLLYRAFPRYEQASQVLEVLRRHPGEGGIVYTQTRKDAERLAKTLSTAKISCEPYHAGLASDRRRRVQEDFVNEHLDVVVATIAFGMGIDRSNVRFVVHANAPKSVEHYQQESGRAGRDGLPAECVLLFSAGDLAKHRALANMDGELPPERAKALERQLKEIGRYAASPLCRHRLLAEHFGAVYATSDCRACDVCLGETKSLPAGEALLVARKIIGAVRCTGGRFGAAYSTNLLIGKAEERMTRRGHDRLPIFGAFKEAGEASVRYWIDQLVVQGYLEVVEEGEYPLLTTTEIGHAFYAGDAGDVRLGVLPPVVRKKRASKRSAAVALAGEEDAPLFERLRALRKLLAARQHVPPYVIFHDTVLVQLAAYKPQDEAAMRMIKGVGDAKLARYGAAFLKVIAGAEPKEAAKE